MKVITLFWISLITLVALNTVAIVALLEMQAQHIEITGELVDRKIDHD